MDTKALLHINVGGQIFTTTEKTFNKIFKHWIIHRINLKQDSDGNVFIDRDEEMFKYILNFCRNGKLILPEDFSKFELLENEAAYFNLEDLVNDIKKEKQKKEKKQNEQHHYIEIVEVRTGEIENESSKIILRVTGRREDIMAVLPSSIVDRATERNVQEYAILRFDGFDERIKIMEFLSKTGWSLETSNMSSSCISYEEGGKVVMKQTFHDRWNKIHHK